MLQTLVTYFNAYIWEMIGHIGIGVAIMIAGGLWAWFMPIGKRLGLLVAIIAGWGLISYSIGVADERRHWNAAEQHTAVQEDTARDKAIATVTKRRASPGVRHDKFDRDAN